YFERLAYEMLEDCAGCNTRYVEISFSPSDHVQRGLDYYDMIDAINRGIAKASRDFSVQCNIRIDLVRNFGPENGMQVLDWIEQKPDNIVSIDIGGSEDKYPAKPFAEVYARAKEMGLHRAAHAGEAAGSESVWQAVKHLEVERIGHGVTARNDQQLLQVLQEKGIAIEACPVSNVRTRVVESIGEHPIREYFDKGLLVTVNSDDPSFFHTNMDNEYIQLGKHLGFCMEDLFQLSLNAIEASFLSTKSKDKMRDAFHREVGRII
ncbi:MAG: adenosine deaminase, partial [Promethearchaeota archaeon]